MCKSYQLAMLFHGSAPTLRISHLPGKHYRDNAHKQVAYTAQIHPFGSHIDPSFCKGGRSRTADCGGLNSAGRHEPSSSCQRKAALWSVNPPLVSTPPTIKETRLSLSLSSFLTIASFISLYATFRESVQK